MRLSRLLLMLPLALCACVTSKDPQFGPDSRVLPFLPGSSFDVSYRGAREPEWGKPERVTLVADQDLVVRELDESGKTKDYPRYTFHAVARGAYVVQVEFEPDRGYAFGALYVRDREGRAFNFNCENVDKASFQEFGGTVDDKYCRTDSMSQPVRFVTELALRPVGDEARYVPVKK